MRKYAFRRLLQLIPILFAITFLSYGMMRIAGSDVVTQKMENTGQILSEDKLNAAREQLGLDKPFLTQYFVWLGKLLHGDMGNSYVSSLPVFDTFISKLPATLLLTVTSILLTIIISIPLGILSAVKQNTITDYLIRLCSFIGNSLPNFFVSLLLMYFLAIRLRIFPVISKDVSLKSVAMPAITLAIAMSAKYLRQVRATVLDELSKRLCGRSESKRSKVFCHSLEKYYEGFAGNHHYLADAVSGKSAGRNCDRRINLYVGWSWKDGSRCHLHA